MADYESIRDEILAVFGTVVEVARDRAAEQTADRLYGAQERLRSGELTVVVCGEFNRGKSSLLNALLDRPNILPVDHYFATCIAATIRRGETEAADVTLKAPDGSLVVKPIRLEQIGEYAAESGSRKDEAVLLDLRLDSHRLKSGLVLVDTPGVGGVYHEHTLVTQEQLPTADAILFVVSAEEPLTESETVFLREAAHAVKAADHPDAMFYVLTKSDRRADIDTDLAANRKKIAAITGRSPEDVLIVPVSSKLKQQYLAGIGGDDPELRAELLHNSGFPQLEEVLWARLARHRARVLLGGALGEADAAVRTLLDPLLAEESALRDTSRARLDELNRETERESARLAELSSGAAPWRKRLEDELDGLRAKVSERTAREFDRVWSRAETEYLSVRMHLEQPDLLALRVNGDLGMARTTVSEWAARRAAELQRGLARDIGLELGGSELGEMPAPPVVDLAAFGRLHKPTERVGHVIPATYRRETRTREKKRASGPPPSGFWNKVKHGWNRTKDFFSPVYETYEKKVLDTPEQRWYETVEREIPEHVIEQRRRELADSVQRARRDQTPRIEQAAQEAIGDFSREITAELDSRIAREQERTADTLKRLKDSAQRTAEEAVRRLGELETEQRPLKDGRERIAALVRAVNRLAEGRSGPGPDAEGEAA
ncbi:dynamin family protein [Streptomyces koelreuteriae]|uniref:dynamin family protein n=1 Tax=Streptomyces koelreuteriae TaxID=2838015 RepID=UPI003EC05882